MSNTRIAQRKRAIPHAMIVTVTVCGVARWTSVTVIVTALCNQPEAVASDLGDYQSLHYLCIKQCCVLHARVMSLVI